MSSLPSFLYFPQWQGSGLTPQVRTGAETLRQAFSQLELPAISVPLAEQEPLTTRHRIIGYEPLHTQLASATALLTKHQPNRLLLLAGDCAAEIAPISYLNQRYANELTILWLDAHADLNTPASSPSGNFHGMPLRLLLDGHFPDTDLRVANPLAARQVIFVGLRDTDPAEDAYIAEHSLHVLPAKDFQATNLLALLAQANAHYLYIHLDLDLLNPVIFPPLQCPVAGGLTPEATAELLSHLIDTYQVVGLSLTETTATNIEELRPIEPILREYRRWVGTLKE
jgi:arginase